MSLIEEICDENLVLNNYRKQEICPLVTFKAKQLLENTAFENFCFKEVDSKEEDITLINDRPVELYKRKNVVAFVVPGQGAILDRGEPYKPCEQVKGKTHLGTYIVANSISWNFLQKDPPNIKDMVETLLLSFKDKLYTDVRDLLVASALENKTNSLNRLKNTVTRNNPYQIISTFFYDTDVEDDIDHFFKGKMMSSHRHHIVEEMKESLNKLGANYPGTQAIIGVAVNKYDHEFGTHALSTPLVVIQRGLGEIFLDTSLHRTGKLSLYGWMNIGVACPSPENLAIAFIKDVESTIVI